LNGRETNTAAFLLGVLKNHFVFHALAFSLQSVWFNMESFEYLKATPKFYDLCGKP
jgi:hypothetical protein